MKVGVDTTVGNFETVPRQNMSVPLGAQEESVHTIRLHIIGGHEFRRKKQRTPQHIVFQTLYPHHNHPPTLKTFTHSLHTHAMQTL
jgi:hypothetical protein